MIPDELTTLVDKLEAEHILEKQELAKLIKNRNSELDDYLFSRSSKIRRHVYGNSVYIRGLIEFTSYCKNDCLYCGLRRSNGKAQRYRLDKNQIMQCCQNGYSLGFRTFVLQGGEDLYFTDDKICEIVSSIKTKYPDCAVTLSIGEKSRESYLKYYEAGADRYLLRHETADEGHYGMLHPTELSAENRKRCLYDLKEIGFQTGSGFMVGSPFQTAENLADDMLFLHELNPHMVGIGPFIAHCDTPFASQKSGTLEQTLFMLGLLRLMLPNALLPATTALGTVSEQGRELGILAGANVVMPNLSPVDVRKKYLLYDNKICTGEEAAECLSCLNARMRSVGCEIVTDRGDYKQAL